LWSEVLPISGRTTEGIATTILGFTAGAVIGTAVVITAANRRRQGSGLRKFQRRAEGFHPATGFANSLTRNSSSAEPPRTDCFSRRRLFTLGS
jgi:hypothetical protein